MNWWKKIAAMLLVLSFSVGTVTALTGCEDDGPVEEAVEEVD